MSGKSKTANTTPYLTTAKIDGQIHEHRYYEPMHGYDKCMVKNVKVVAFDNEDRILTVRDGNRIDIVNGSIEWDDDTPEDAARREAMEKANVTLGEVSLGAVIESKPKGGSSGQAAVTLVMTARIKSIDPYKSWQGAPKRAFLTKEELFKKLGPRKSKDLTRLIDMASFALVEETLTDPVIKHIIDNF